MIEIVKEVDKEVINVVDKVDKETIKKLCLSELQS